MKKNETIGKISGLDLQMNRQGKLNRTDGAVKSGAGYHKSSKQYNRKGKKNQQLKNKLKNYHSSAAILLLRLISIKTL